MANGIAVFRKLLFSHTHTKIMNMFFYNDHFFMKNKYFLRQVIFFLLGELKKLKLKKKTHVDFNQVMPTADNTYCRIFSGKKTWF